MAPAANSKFTLLDAMVLIAATAFGLAISMGNLRAMSPALPPVIRALLAIVPCAGTWTIALALLYLRRPRPSIHDISRRPGSLACGAAMLAFSFRLLEFF